MVPLFGDDAVLDVEDPVAVADGAEAVGHDEGGPALQQGGDAVLHQPLGVGVHAAGGLVQDQDPGIGKQGAGKGDELLLPGAEALAPFLGLGVVPVFHVLDEVVRVDGFRRRDAFLVRGVQTAVADIVHDGAGEDEGVLLHDAHLPPQGAEGDALEVVAVNAHGPFRYVIEAGEQVHDGAFAGAGGTHQGDGLARLHVEAHMMDNGDALFVLEEHVPEFHMSLDRGQLRRPLVVLHAHRLVQHLEDPFQVAHGVHELVVDIADLHDRLPEPVGVHDHGGDGADLHHAAHDEVLPEPVYRCDIDGALHDAHDHGGDGVHAVGHVGGAQLIVPVLIQQAVEDAAVHFLPGEGLGDLGAVDVFREVGGDVALLVGGLLAVAPLHGLGHGHVKDEDRKTRQHHQGHLGAEGEHEAQGDEQVDQGQDGVDEAVRQEVRHVVHVVDDPGEDLPVGTAVIVIEAQLLEMRVHVGAHVRGHALAGIGADEAFFLVDEDNADVDDEVAHAQDDDGADGLMALGNEIVDDVRLDPGDHQTQDAGDDRQDEHDGDGLLILFDVDQAALELGPVERCVQFLIDIVLVSCHQNAPPSP